MFQFGLELSKVEQLPNSTCLLISSSHKFLTTIFEMPDQFYINNFSKILLENIFPKSEKVSDKSDKDIQSQSCSIIFDNPIFYFELWCYILKKQKKLLQFLLVV